MGQQAGSADGMSAGRTTAVIALFTAACETFSQALERSDNLLDATDFTGALHILGYTAGRVRALGEALTLLTGDLAWTRHADEVLAEYMQATPVTEQGEVQ